ncbi:MAG: YgiT-type zinc finger protein [Pseudomonadota bacterium]|nr:YgiT-type zinc finger protein [Pseudomonadota bacterium]
METEHLICPACEQTELIPKRADEIFCYKGQDFILEDIEYSVCPHCQAEVVTPAQSQHNEARIREEHCRIDGLLTSQESVIEQK